MKSKRIVSVFMFTMFFGSKVGAQGEATRSLPMIIIIDHNRQEHPFQGLGDTLALTIDLYLSIRSNKFPILVTKSVLYNLLYRKEHADEPDFERFQWAKRLPFEPFNGKEGWRIYDVNNGLFALLVPSQFLDQHKYHNGLNIDGNGKSLVSTLQDITNVFKRGSYLKELKAMADAQGSFKASDLKRVFRAKVSPPQEKEPREIISLRLKEMAKSWNIIISGHGGVHTGIAGLDRDELRGFLSFLNTQINTALLFVMSCYVGGVNRINFKDIAGEQLGSSLNYMVIVQGVTDQWTVAALDADFFNTFFSIAQLIDKGTNLNKILNQINSSFSMLGVLHPTAHIPQVLLPGGLEFQTFNINKRVLSLGYVFVEKHRLENRPIETEFEDVILIYPPVVSPVFKLKPSLMLKSWEAKLKLMSPAGFELLKKTGKRREEEINKHSEYFPAYVAYKKRGVFEELYKEKVYPAFISMEPIAIFKQHKLNRIEVEGKVGIAQGVMQFLRDAFNIEELKTTQQFYIDKLIGPNDLSLVMELSRAEAKKYNQPYELEKLLNQVIGEEVTLEKVMVETGPTTDTGFSITFIISIKDELGKENKSAWQAVPTVAKDDKNKEYPFWDFRQVSVENHEFNYSGWVKRVESRQPAVPVEQKSIPEILKQKLLRGPLKIKEPEAPQAPRATKLHKESEMPKPKLREAPKWQPPLAPKPQWKPPLATPPRVQPAAPKPAVPKVPVEPKLPEPKRPLPKPVAPKMREPEIAPKPTVPKQTVPKPAEPKVSRLPKWPPVPKEPEAPKPAAPRVPEPKRPLPKPATPKVPKSPVVPKETVLPPQPGLPRPSLHDVPKPVFAPKAPIRPAVQKPAPKVPEPKLPEPKRPLPKPPVAPQMPKQPTAPKPSVPKPVEPKASKLPKWPPAPKEPEAPKPAAPRAPVETKIPEPKRPLPKSPVAPQMPRPPLVPKPLSPKPKWQPPLATPALKPEAPKVPKPPVQPKISKLPKWPPN